ncbi:MAG: LacI family DNA-binding transcriptional regulator [candidate division KSB1 bacterium]|nr:LacI family DNA-binding transcriptional regulator [candidate division KSB1 bacterium]
MNHKLTLKDIAKQVNVSPALVSQILNGKGRASEQIRTRITDLLEENGYRPKYARSPFYYLIDLARVEYERKTQNILEQLSGIQQVFDDLDLIFHVEFIRSTPAEKQLNSIVERKPSGVIINTDASFLDTACDIFSQAGIPLVQTGYDTENTKYNAVVTDSFSGAYTATEHLIQQGHQRIGILRWSAGSAAINSNKKYAGYMTALSDHGLEVDPALVRSSSATQGDPGWQPARNMLLSLLEQDNPPTALFIENSFISLSLLYPLLNGNDGIPECIQKLDMVHVEDWSLQPVHDILTGKLFAPDINTKIISIDWESIGRQAARFLIERAGQRTPTPKLIRIGPMLYQLKGEERIPILKKGVSA